MPSVSYLSHHNYLCHQYPILKTTIIFVIIILSLTPPLSMSSLSYPQRHHFLCHHYPILNTTIIDVIIILSFTPSSLSSTTILTSHDKVVVPIAKVKATRLSLWEFPSLRSSTDLVFDVVSSSPSNTMRLFY